MRRLLKILAWLLGFVVLLLVPGLPGCLNLPGYVMLGMWVLMGVVFYVVRARKIR